MNQRRYCTVDSTDSNMFCDKIISLLRRNVIFDYDCIFLLIISGKRMMRRQPFIGRQVEAIQLCRATCMKANKPDRNWGVTPLWVLCDIKRRLPVIFFASWLL